MFDKSILEKLILFAYNELSEEDNITMQSLIVCDQAIRNEYIQIKDAITSLNEEKTQPSEDLLKNILNHCSQNKIKTI